MSTKLLSTDSSLSKVIERQMRNWELARSQQPIDASRRQPAVRDFITISREPGSGGTAIAHLLGERLGWPVFDKQILSLMAGDDDVRAQLYHSMDERDMGWLEETLRAMGDADFRRNDYFRKLTETILVLARQSPSVFVGRAADLILPRNRGLRVGVTASRGYRVQQFQQRYGLTRDEAREEITRLEEERAAWIRNHFRLDAAEASRHELIINCERWPQEQVVNLILTARNMKISLAAR